jgi:hypothetical protein
MPNLSTLSGRLLTQELGNEDSTVLFTDARRIGGVFDGIREFADLTECYIRVSSVTLTGGVGEYDLHASTIVASQDFVRFASDQAVEVHYTDASSHTTYLSGEDLPERTVRWLDMHEPGWRDSTAVSSGMQLPRCVYRRVDGGRMWLGFYPVPSTGSSAAMKALVPYVAYPSVSTNSTHVPFTDTSGNTRWDLQPYHQAFAHYAAHQLEKLRRDDQASDRQKQAFMVYVQRYLQAMRRKGGGALTYARRYFRRGTSMLEGQDPRT